MLDQFAQQIADWLTIRTGEDYRRYLILLLGLWVAYRLTRWIIRRFAPWLLGRVVFPWVASAVVVVCILALVAQTVLALPFRAVQARPPGLVFSAGDVAIAVARRASSAVPLWASRTRYLHQVPRVVILAILATVGWWGHETVCRESAQSAWCERPVAAANAVGDDVWEHIVTVVRDVFAP